MANRPAFLPPAHVSSAGRSTIGELFRSRVAVCPNAIAVQEGERELSYGTLNDRVNRLTNALHAMGIRRYDRLGLLTQNCIEYLELELAAAKLGAITAALNWRLSRSELLHCVNLVEPKLILVQEDLTEQLVGLDLLVPQILTLGDAYEAVLASADAREPNVAVDPEDGLVILYTSGTTGLPKGALISHRAMIARAFAFTSELQIAPQEAFVAWAPFFHMVSTDHSLATLLRGGKVIVVNGFHSERLIHALETERIGWFVLIPGMLEAFSTDLGSSTTFTPKGIRVCGAMADLVAPQQIAEITEHLKAPYLNSFGATETGLPPATRSVIPVGVAPSDLAKEQSAFCEVRLVAPNDEDVIDNEAGELAIKGPTLFSGYWNANETNATDFRGGWFHMGDVFRRLPDGRLAFVDRSKYMIKSGGENIYPAEIERVLLSDPRIVEAAVVRTTDATWGEAPVAFVARESDTVTEQDLLELCRAALAGYKKPREIYFIERHEFPRSTSGKIQRHELETRLEKNINRVKSN